MRTYLTWMIPNDQMDQAYADAELFHTIDSTYDLPVRQLGEHGHPGTITVGLSRDRSDAIVLKALSDYCVKYGPTTVHIDGKEDEDQLRNPETGEPVEPTLHGRTFKLTFWQKLVALFKG